jgi:protein-disulfide isomerase
LWLGDVPFPTGVDEQGRPWIGAENPEVTVVEYTDYACPHCRIGSSRLRMRLAAHPDELRIVRGQQPRMRCVASRVSCQFVRAAVCAGDQGKFWQMDSWLFAHAPEGGFTLDLEAAARDVGLDHDELARCWSDPTTMERAEVLGKDARDAKIRETPAYVIDGEKLSPSEAHELLEDRL